LSPADSEELLASQPYSTTQSLEHQLANRLLMLAGPYGVSSAKGLKIELHLPQETLAQLIGSTRHYGLKFPILEDLIDALGEPYKEPVAFAA
jgi:hypothetical protein